MAKINPEAFAVLSHIKRQGLDTWLPGKLVTAQLQDSTFTRVNSRIITDLITTGYLAADNQVAISASVAVGGQSHYRGSNINESQARVGGRLFEVVTEEWGIEADALRLRKLVLGGLAFVAQNDAAKFERIHQRTRDGLEDEALKTIVIAAMSLVTGKYSEQFAGLGHRVAIRVFMD